MSTLTFEAVTPVRFNTKNKGVVKLEPGQRLTWPTPAVESLLARIPDKIRVIENKPQNQPGVWVEFFSPLFGMCTARIHSVDVETVWLTSHSVLKGTDEPCRIPASWICGVYMEEQAR